MKKSGLILLCIFLFLLAVGTGAVWLFLTPRGALRSDLPEAVVEKAMAEKAPKFWLEEYIRQTSLPVTEFEDETLMKLRLFNAAVGSGELTFRPEESESSQYVQSYIITVGEADLFRAVTSYRDRTWQAPEFIALPTLQPAVHEIEVLLPSDAVLTVNGKPVGDAYIKERFIPYPDMTELELQFDEHPTRTLYAISGLYEAPLVAADRPGGILLLSAGNGRWEYTLPDAAGYAFAVRAPRDAAVTLGGVQLGDENIAASSVYATELDIPAELQSFLPEYVTYTAGGLYSLPEITAALPDGTPLSSSLGADGVTTFTLSGADGLRDQHEVIVLEFLRNLITYGSGNATLGGTAVYVARNSPVQKYLNGAINSLHWTVHVTLTIHDIVTADYVALGDGGFLCHAHADFSTSTYYQQKDISLDYDMIWINQDGVWRLWDLAYK